MRPTHPKTNDTGHKSPSPVASTADKVNYSPDQDCDCKRPVKRKPYRLIRVTLRPEFIEGRVNPKMVLEVWPDGLLVLRESKRRRRYQTNVGKVYRGCVWREAMLIAQAAKKAKKGRRRRRR